MLRKPLDHVLSYYVQEIRRLENGLPSNVLKSKNDTFNDIFKNPRRVQWITNHQIRNFTRDVDLVSILRKSKKDL